MRIPPAQRARSVIPIWLLRWLSTPTTFWLRLTSPTRDYCLCYSNLNHRSVINTITISCVKTNIKGSAGFLRRDLFALNNLKISVIWPLVKIYKNLFCKNSQFQHIKFWIPVSHKFIGKRPPILYNKYGCCQNGKRFAFRRNGNILRTSSIIGGDTNGKFNERYINDRNSGWRCRYCSYDYQHHRDRDQYRADQSETKALKSNRPPSQGIGCFLEP